MVEEGGSPAVARAPMYVPSGAPRIIAKVHAEGKLRDRRGPLVGRAADTTITIALAKKVAVTRAVTTRAANRTPYPGASAEIRLPAIPATPQQREHQRFPGRGRR